MNSWTPPQVREISGYKCDTMQMTGCNKNEAGMIHDVMLNVILDGSLHRRRAKQLKEAAMEAKKALSRGCLPREECNKVCKQPFEHGTRAGHATTPTKKALLQTTYEI